MNDFYLIGLIGSIGSGKSTVRKMLEQLGAHGIDADALAHVVMARGSPTWRAVVNTFGVEILGFTGRIDRRRLGERVFADPSRLEKLESIVHPAVRTMTTQLLRENQKSVVVVEAIKLVESGMHRWCDALWVVNCKLDSQVERVMQSRGLSEKEARARLAAQGPFEDKLRMAQVVIDNSGDLKSTREQVEKAWRVIYPETARDKREWLEGVPPAAPAPVPARGPEGEIPPPPPPLVEKPQTSPPPVKELEVRRSRRSDIEALSVAIARRENRPAPLPREETLKRFGEHGYRIAVIDKEIVALAAWEAENLVATVREIWADSPDHAALALPRLFGLIEGEAHDLLCEVVLLLIDSTAPYYVAAQSELCEYEPKELDALHPVWRQTAKEKLRPGDRIWGKQLREDLITKPF